MRIDHAAVARASMRSRTRDAAPHRLTAAQKDAQRAHSVRLELVRSGCIHCCGLLPFNDQGDQGGARISCPLLSETYRNRLSPDEEQTAETCRIPPLYAEVQAGGRTDLREEDVLPLLPFEVSAGHVHRPTADAAPEVPEDQVEADEA